MSEYPKNRPHLFVKYCGDNCELYDVLLDITDAQNPNGSENFEISDNKIISFFYETGCEERAFLTHGKWRKCESSFDHKKHYNCFHIKKIEEIKTNEAEKLADLV